MEENNRRTVGGGEYPESCCQNLVTLLKKKGLPKKAKLKLAVVGVFIL